MATIGKTCFLCDCNRCGSSRLVNHWTRLRHLQKYRRSVVSYSTPVLLDNSLDDVMLEDDQGDDEQSENSSEVLKLLMTQENDEDSCFSYELFSNMEIPEPFRKNFIKIAWKTRCNVSDNAYDQSIDLRGEGYLKLKACRRALLKWSGINDVEIDCCRHGKCKSYRPVIWFLDSEI